MNFERIALPITFEIEARGRHRLLPELPLADDEIADAALRLLDEPRDVRRIVLHVAVEEQHVGGRAGERDLEAGANRRALARLWSCRTTAAPAAAAAAYVPSVDPSSTTITATREAPPPSPHRRCALPR